MEQFVFALSFLFFLGMFILLACTTAFAGAFLLKERKRARLGEFTPPVSVVIPAYNEGERIGRCLHALRNQDYPPLEIIVVDDGSTDRTRDVAREQGATVIRQQHEGKVAALNRGIAAAKEGFVLTIDADTFLSPRAVREVVRPLQDPRVGAVSGIANVANRSSLLGAYQAVEYPYISLLREVFSSVFRVTPGICGALTCFRKEALQEVGGFRATTVLEDFDIAMHLAKRGYIIATAPRAVGETVVPAQARGLLKQRARWLKGSMQCFLSHRDAFAGRRFAMHFILVAQLFWFIYSFFALPLMLFHMAYWLPANAGSLFDLGFYAFRWASLAGVFYLLAMIPVWGVNWVYVFGVLAGLVSSAFYLVAVRRYDRVTWRTALAVFFFFPYTLVMSVFMVGGVLSFFASRGKGTFVN